MALTSGPLSKIRVKGIGSRAIPNRCIIENPCSAEQLNGPHMLAKSVPASLDETSCNNHGSRVKVDRHSDDVAAGP
jgi:hypothetical protein